MAGATLVTASTLLAISVTGTVISSLTVTILVLFLPRFIIYFYTLIITHLLPILTVNDMGILFNVNYNIPFNFIFQISNSFITVYQNDMFFNYYSIIYTFVLAIIYFTFGLLIYQKRKAETSGKGSPNRVLQHIYRILITLPITLMITCTYFTSTNKENFIKDNFITTALLLAASLLIYFLYELFTTKRLKNLLKVAPYFLIVIALNGLFYFAIAATQYVVLNTKPTADEIEWVTFNNTDQSMYETNYINYSTRFGNIQSRWSCIDRNMHLTF
jgi:hypothetical protein